MRQTQQWTIYDFSNKADSGISGRKDTLPEGNFVIHSTMTSSVG
jgi:hypothetical protein